MSRLKNLFCFHFLAKWALGPFLYKGKNSTGRSDSISFLPSNAWNLLHCYLVIQSLFLLVCNCLCRLLILLVPASGLEMLISFFFAVCATQSFICPTQDFNLVVVFFFFFFFFPKRDWRKLVNIKENCPQSNPSTIATWKSMISC